MAEKNGTTIILLSGDMDKVFAAFTLASSAAAAGMNTTIFFTFWGLKAIQKGNLTGKGFMGRMIGLLNRGGLDRLNPSKFSFGGMGRWMFGKMMGAHNVATLPELRDLAVLLGVRMYGCQMSMDVMEIPAETFIEGVKEPVGVGYFLMKAQEADVQFFI